MNNIQVLILAGGIGKRMKPLVGDKLFLPILGKPLISWLIEDLKKAGVAKIIIVGNKNNLLSLKKLFKGKRFSFGLQKEPRGMANAILSVKKFSSMPLLVLNADDIFSPNFFKDFLRFVEQRKKEVIFTGIKKEEYFPGGYFVLRGKEVKGLIEKPPKGKEPSQFIKLVVDYFKRPAFLLELLKKVRSKRDDLYEVTLDKIIKKEKVGFYPYEGGWAAVKFPWHILDFQALVLQDRLKEFIATASRRKPQVSAWGMSRSSSEAGVAMQAHEDSPTSRQGVFVSPKAEIAKDVKLRDRVFIAEGVKIFEGAVIVGPTFIGKNSIIGNHTLIRESQIAQDCLIGSGTEVARSFIGPGCWLHRNYIGDSVLEEDVKFGAGAVTANFRLDEGEINFRIRDEQYPTGREKLGAIIARSARIGINASLMPGISIGQDTWVGPSVVLKESLEEGERKKK